MYEKWGTIKHVPHVPIWAHNGEQSGAHLKSYFKYENSVNVEIVLVGFYRGNKIFLK